MKMPKKVMGIDPGKKGALLTVDTGRHKIKNYNMPIAEDGFVCFKAVENILKEEKPDLVILERAKAMAMGSHAAFNYGRDFQILVLCLQLNNIKYELVDPSVWHRQLLGTDDIDMKPKVRCENAVKRLYPKYYSQLPRAPRSGKVLDGPVDALLIASYGIANFL